MAPTSDAHPRSSQKPSQKPSQSMLGALLSTAASALKGPPHAASGLERPARSLESIQEEAYTRSLLFPEQPSTYRPHEPLAPLHADVSVAWPTMSGVCDGAGRIDLQSPRDIRIIIAQDASGSQPKAVLYDSKLPPGSTTAPQPQQRSTLASGEPASSSFSPQGVQGAHLYSSSRADDPLLVPHASGLAAHPGTSSILGGAFERSKRRDLHALQAGTNDKILANEPVGEMRLLLDCMFGTTPLSYRGDTTKLHVFPNDERPGARPSQTSPLTREGSGSWGRAGESRRKSQLSYSCTPSDLPTVDASMGPTSGPAIKDVEKRTVLLTRTFSVPLPNVIEAAREEHPKEPVPASRPATTKPPGSKGVGQRRAPMYAVALVLQIPTSNQIPGGALHGLASEVEGKEPSSSSFEHETRSGWLFLDPASGLPSSSSSSIYSSDVDDCVDVVTQRFDFVTRALSSIQSTVRAKLFTLLQQTAASSSQHVPPLYSAQTRYLDEQRRVPHSAERPLVKPSKHLIVQVPPAALIADEEVRQVAEGAARRLAAGLRIPKVITGQGRWGTWRDEARWIQRWGGGKEQNFFFFHLLTAFLGNHTEWLNILGPSRYRRRQEQLQTAGLADDCAITSRTIVIGHNRAAARRLIFLLSSFLPPTSAPVDNPGFGWGGRPGTSGTYSHSTSTASPSRGSLRRTRNKRTGAHRGDLEVSEAGRGESGTDEVYSNDENRPGPGRSEIHAVKTASLPIPQSNASTRKSSATTIATITPATTTPRFSSHHAGHHLGTAMDPAPSHGGSLASINLMHTLKRNDSTDHSHTSSDSQPASRWGSLISGFWSNRRDSSTDDSEVTVPSEEGYSAVLMQRHRSGGRQSGGKLAQMVMQVDKQRALTGRVHEDIEPPVSPGHSLPPAAGLGLGHSPLRPRGGTNTEISHSGSVPDSPLKFSVDEKDGVVDVEVPLPSFFSSSCGSPIRSLSTSGFMSGASFEEASSSHHSQLSTCLCPNVEVDPPVSVAGWLKRYHPDFPLQAVPPYAQLEHEIKQSMRGEPTPTHSGMIRIDEKTQQEWVCVCTTLLADTETFTVRRLRLFRRASPLPKENADASDSEPTHRPLSGNPLSHKPADDFFTNDPIFDIDPTLIDAVERLTLQMRRPTETFTSSSRSSSVSRPRRSQANTGAGAGSVDVEDVIPRQECEKIILGALDQVVRRVMAERNPDDDDNDNDNDNDDDIVSGGGVSGSKETVEGRQKAKDEESSLREGVRKWFYDIETGC